LDCRYFKEITRRFNQSLSIIMAVKYDVRDENAIYEVVYKFILKFNNIGIAIHTIIILNIKE